VNVADYLETLKREDVHVRVEDGKLRVNAPVGILTAERRAQLAQRKTEIIAFLDLVHSERLRQPAIVPLQPLGRKPPIFGAAGHNGDIFCYRAFAQHLGPDQPFFGLQPQGYDPGTEPLRRVEDLAGYFARQIMAFRPGEECVIVGYCAGGTVAFELIRQLRAAGHPVKRFVLIGAPIGTWYRWPTYTLALTNYWIRRVLRLMLREIRGGGRHATRTLRERMAQRNAADAAQIELLARRKRVEHETARAVMRYEPEPQDIDADIILPASYVVQSRKSLLQWTSFLRSHREFTCLQECTNETMLLPGSAAQVAQLFALGEDANSRGRNPN
jgi:thioesterase domain-containing protein